MVKVYDIKSTSTFAWSSDKKPLVVTGTVAGAVDADFSSSATLSLINVLTKETLFTSAIPAKLHALDWSLPFADHTQGLIAGAFENGSVHLWDAALLLSSADLAKATVAQSDHHTGPVRAALFNRLQPHILATTGTKGEIFVWDTKTLAKPTRPGQAMSPMEDVTSVAWNNLVPHIFATAGSSGFASIWDLKAKREVLHLSYSGSSGRANLATVAWHPTQSTKLVTASDNDGTPLILTWDLRNANAPEKIMEGHTKGVLSLDWCAQDPELMLSSGKDNCTSLWNPVLGIKLGEYPTSANWAFKTRFAPSAPDLVATASFDGTIAIQTLQDTSAPVSSRVKSTNEDDFWTQISTTDTQQPQFSVKQAPRWLKAPGAVSFGFGGKIVIVKNNLAENTAKVVLTRLPASSEASRATKKLEAAIVSGDFTEIISERVASGSADWKLLEQMALGDKLQLLNRELKPTVEDDDDDEILDNVDDSFFEKLSPAKSVYTPTGKFSVDTESPLVQALLAGRLEDASTICLNNNQLMEALIIALNGTDDMKDTVRNAYFAQYGAKTSVARLLYSASKNDASDLVENIEVANWRAVAVSIKTYATSDELFNQHITALGDRLLLSTEADSRSHAVACYVAGGALEKLASIWLKEVPVMEQRLLTDLAASPAEAHMAALADFVEKVTVYRATFKVTGELKGKDIPNAFLQYATILAGSGNFDLAERCLQLLPSDIPGLKVEKERISKATGTRAAPQASLAGAKAIGTKASGSRVPVQRPLYAPPATQGQGLYSGAASGIPAYPGVPPAPPAFGAPPPLVSSVSAPPPAGGYRSNSPPSRVYGVTPTAAAIPSRANPYAPTALGSLQTHAAAPALAPPPVGTPNGTALSSVDSSQNPTKGGSGWNDLPITFPSKPVRRAAAVAVSSAQPPSKSPITLRSTSFTQQAPLPPPKAPVAKTPPMVEPVPAPPKPTNRYAPPPQLTPSKPVPGNPPPMPTLSAPNPYAPSAPASGSLLNIQAYGGPQPPSFTAPPVQAFPPKANPYAPPSNGYAQSGGVAASGSTPPPNGFSPPPVGFAPPPKRTAQANFKLEPPPSSKPAAAAPPAAQPSGLSVEAQKVCDTFATQLAAVKPLMPESRAKHVNDTEKRLNLLYGHLQRGDLSDAAVSRVHDVALALEAKNYDAALTLYGEISTVFGGECGDWAKGVKRLIGMASATAV